jgi:hypothetical protein
MSQEPDPARRQGPGNVYDAQFAERISRISRGGGKDTSSTGRTRRGWGGGMGVGGFIVLVLLLIRVVAAGTRGCSESRPPSYAPPTIPFKSAPFKDPRFEKDWQQVPNWPEPPRRQGEKERERIEKRMRELLGEPKEQR